MGASCFSRTWKELWGEKVLSSNTVDGCEQLLPDLKVGENLHTSCMHPMSIFPFLSHACGWTTATVLNLLHTSFKVLVAEKHPEVNTYHFTFIILIMAGCRSARYFPKRQSLL